MTDPETGKGPGLRVLNICETARGGVGVYLGLLADLGARGHDMHFLMPAQDAGFQGADMGRHEFDRPRRGVRSTAAMIRRTLSLIRDLDPDVVCFHSTFALAGLAAMRLRGDRRPALYTPHGWAVQTYAAGSLPARVARAVEGRLAGLADRVVCVSRYEARVAAELGYRGRTVVIENGARPPRPDARDTLFRASGQPPQDAPAAGRDGTPGAGPDANPDARPGTCPETRPNTSPDTGPDTNPDTLNLLFVGRLDRQKGFDLLAEAVARCGRADLRLHVVGGAVRGDSTATEGLDPRITLHGWVAAEEIDDWYRSADALILPSRWEACPLVIPEALRNGTPVLCSDRGGMPDLVAPDRTGLIFPLSVDAITAMLDGLDLRTLRAMRPACHQAYATRFRAERVLDEVETLLRRLTGPARDGP